MIKIGVMIFHSLVDWEMSCVTYQRRVINIFLVTYLTSILCVFFLVTCLTSILCIFFLVTYLTGILGFSIAAATLLHNCQFIRLIFLCSILFLLEIWSKDLLLHRLPQPSIGLGLGSVSRLVWLMGTMIAHLLEGSTL